MQLPRPIAEAVEIAINRLLEADLVNAERLSEHAGKLVDIRIDGTAMQVAILIVDRAIALIDLDDTTANVTVSGSPADFLAVLKQGSSASGRLQIDGDTELGSTLLAVARDLQIDWEGWLANVIGGSNAHLMRKTVDGVWAEAAKTGKDLQNTLRDFLQYESRLLVDRGAAEEFSSAVDRLREDTDRLAARIERLQREAAKKNAKEDD